MSVILDLDNEEGDFSDYDTTATGGGDLSVEAAAALGGTSYGLQFLIDGTTVMYGQKDAPSEITTGVIRFRLLFDINDLAMGSGDMFRFLYIYRGTSASIAWLALEESGGDFQLRLQCNSDTGGRGTDPTNLTGSHCIECLMTRESSDGAADGILMLKVDGSEIDNVTNLENYDTFTNWQRIYLITHLLDAGTAGTIYMDEFIARDDNTEIGCPAGGTIQEIGLAAESDTPLAVGSLKLQEPGLAAEGDTPLALTVAKSMALGLAAAIETPLSLTGAKSRILGLSAEIDTPLSPQVLKTLALGLVVETDTPLAISSAGTTVQAVGLALETDTPLGLTAVKTRPLALLTETDSALALTAAKAQTLGLLSETGSPLALAATKTRTLGLLTETGTVLALAMLKAYTLGLLTETDAPLGLILPIVIGAYGTVYRPNRTGTVDRPNRTGAVYRPNRTGTVMSDRQGD